MFIVRYLNLKEIKNVELNILLNFDQFCKNNSLRYYLSGGTLLGAIRHKGFIPWDDDIDVCMPRPDYEKFVRLFKNDNNLELITNKLDNFSLPFAKIVDRNTFIENKYSNDEHQNALWIDIFPVDGLPDEIKEVEKIYKECNFYRTILGLNSARLGVGKTVFRRYIKYILKPFAKLYGKKRCVNNIELLAFKNLYTESKYVGAVTWGLYGIGERMLKSEFEKVVEVEFEGYKFPTFSCWDSYLNGLYNDYMSLPPLEKRKTHDMIAYLIEKGD